MWSCTVGRESGGDRLRLTWGVARTGKTGEWDALTILLFVTWPGKQGRKGWNRKQENKKGVTAPKTVKNGRTEKNNLRRTSLRNHRKTKGGELKKCSGGRRKKGIWTGPISNRGIEKAEGSGENFNGTGGKKVPGVRGNLVDES